MYIELISVTIIIYDIEKLENWYNIIIHSHYF